MGSLFLGVGVMQIISAGGPPNRTLMADAELYEVAKGSRSLDAWLVEVKDTANGLAGYVSTLPQDISHKPTKERVSRGSRPKDWEPK
jgi:hypothetical protein